MHFEIQKTAFWEGTENIIQLFDREDLRVPYFVKLCNMRPNRGTITESMESDKMKYSQIQIKEHVVIIIRNFEMVTEAPHASGLLPVTNCWQNNSDTHSVVLRQCMQLLVFFFKYKKIKRSIRSSLFSTMFYFVNSSHKIRSGQVYLIQT